MQLDPEIVAALVAGVGSITTALVASIKLLTRRVDNMLRELRPNGGSTIKDKVDRLEKRIDDIYYHLVRSSNAK